MRLYTVTKLSDFHQQMQFYLLTYFILLFAARPTLILFLWIWWRRLLIIFIVNATYKSHQSIHLICYCLHTWEYVYYGCWCDEFKTCVWEAETKKNKITMTIRIIFRNFMGRMLLAGWDTYWLPYLRKNN